MVPRTEARKLVEERIEQLRMEESVLGRAEVPPTLTERPNRPISDL